ncbi:hypothetical protein LF1_01840 [Rubripirellula obstinata]|uniref:Uncharacterized protein n=1 Tax=Rubripirellula obstinata TaxID=406547 RepID=A0A5B1CAW2_9BACT|nr:hypothetical protein LF1_01840 [Rubripirellula obstinata]
MLLPNCKSSMAAPAVRPQHQPRRRAAMLLPNCKVAWRPPPCVRYMNHGGGPPCYFQTKK